MSTASICFVMVVVLTLLITTWAARRGQHRSSMYAAGGRITGTQNGLAIAGDFMSATTVLGITGLYLGGGWDTTIYYLAPLAGLALLLTLVAGPLRRLGRYTIGDVLTSRLAAPRLRLFSGVNTVLISLVYLIAQMVGAGTLISLLFGLPFRAAVIIIGTLMATYVAVGGMLAATWVQIVKAVLLMTAVCVLVVLTLARAGGLAALYARAAAAGGSGLFQPGGFHLTLFSALSLGFGMVLGMVGLPHLLIRFFTVPDARAAGRSVAVASTLIAAVNMMLFLVVGPAVLAFVKNAPQFRGANGLIRGGGNMATVHLASAIGGPLFNGIISAVAFSTILAVVAGLTIAAASAVSHDLYRTLQGGGEVAERTELAVFRLAALVVAIAAISLAIVFQHENIAFLSALAFAIAASTNFPLLILVLYWRRLTAAGALIGGATGLVCSVALIIVGPEVWVKVLGHPSALFPSEYPTLISAPLALVTAMIVSLATAPASAELGAVAAP